MSLNQSRSCPLCCSKAAGITFPYATQFNNIRFTYLKCNGCASVFVDPVPDSQTFALMYTKANYHDSHYDGKVGVAYTESAQLLKKYLHTGALVLDYGCGVGGFLKALGKEEFIPYGVEFDKEAANFAGQNAGCKVMSVDDFMAQPEKPNFDAIHLGDVLEHLPNPAGTLKELLGYLKPGGILFVEGPLEINASPVYWTARMFGAIKSSVWPNFTASHAPTHLFRTDAAEQFAFFTRVEPCLDLKSWNIYETGWPYASGGMVKRAISALAVFLSSSPFLGKTFGNRFCGIFTYRESAGALVRSNAAR